MIAFDTDVLTEILLGNAKYVSQALAIPEIEQAVPIIVIEEIMRGRLNVIRQAEAGKSKISIEYAYELFQETFSDFRRIQILSYTFDAELLYKRLRQQQIRIATHDLRIAAICMTRNAKLISRNRRDFEQVPGLMVEFWS
jgi:tRNA(fMet)-specific endonuclease VapC